MKSIGMRAVAAIAVTAVVTTMLVGTAQASTLYSVEDARHATPEIKIDGVSTFDPLSVVEGQGLVGKDAIAGKERVASNDAQAKLNGRASEVRPVSVSPILNGSRTTTEDGLTVERVGDSYGAVTGIGQQGLNASYIVINDPAAPQ